MALFAFLAEVARTRSMISEPMPGEIRLQWWRDAIGGIEHGAVGSNPLAAALLEAMGRDGLPAATLQAVLDGRTFDLYDDPMPETHTFEGYAGEVWSGPMALAMGYLASEPAGQFADAAGHGGVALTVARVLTGFHHWTARGQTLIPKPMLDEAGTTPDALRLGKQTAGLSDALKAFIAYGQSHVHKAQEAARSLPSAAYPILLPVSLASRTFKEAEGWADDPFRGALSHARWKLLWRVWRASKRMPRL